MRYVPELNRLFLHIPKTGGVSVEMVIDQLYPPRNRHKGVRVSRSVSLKHRWNGLPGRHVLIEHLTTFSWCERSWKFCFVRHPVDWYVSSWRWLASRAIFRVARDSSLDELFSFFTWHPKKPLIPCLRGNDFNAWALEVLRLWPNGYLSELCDNYCGTIDKPKVNWIGRCELLESDIKQLFPGVAEVPRANQAKGPIGPPEIDDKVMDAILKAEDRMFSRFYDEDTFYYRDVKDWQ